MRELVRDVFARHFGNPDLDVSADAVCLPGMEGRLVVTTDGSSSIRWNSLAGISARLLCMERSTISPSVVPCHAGSR